LNYKYKNDSGIIIKEKKIKFFNKHILKNLWYYIFLVPGIMFFIIFHYLPMYGVKIAFQDFNIANINASRWVGLKHFNFMFSSDLFYRAFFNTIIISLNKLIFGFPFPLIVSLMLNDVNKRLLKRTIQSFIFVPHFISWPVIGGIAYAILSPESGAISILFKALNMESISFLGDSKYFISLLVATDIWKGFGWGTIIYLSALTSIDPTLYEAAVIDGAGKLKQILHVTLPCISNIIVILLILRMGQIMNAGFLQVMSMYNPAVYDVSEIIETFVYKTGIIQMRYSFTTAVGLFNSVIGMTLVLITNYIARKYSDESLF